MADETSTTETRQDKFRRLAAKRMTALLKAFRLVGNLAGANYEYDQDDIDKIINAIDIAKEQLEYQFAEPVKSDNVSFSFDEPVEDEPESDNSGEGLSDVDVPEDFEVTEHSDVTG